eukprot:CAMPEP_0206423372 /NCGR_PEP_ID=MMETSP0324_2-20121206/2644_1 /ASSEMBLY_ACC=CAM_ASM_000836 /TAXON_ID=2866 /ORGANISM="Crypthecodinium cohnii, Strain Seligo" /LENGTH=319 /DNA_ID=CAMNT_0053887925 /DNA_START=97 /DNA_END=1057 /DNA_ORIENTATION=-
MEVGRRVQVEGRGMGLVMMDNEDGTWNVEFDDGSSEADVHAKDMQPAQDPQEDMFKNDYTKQFIDLPSGARVVKDFATIQVKPGWTRFAVFSDTHSLHHSIPSKHRPACDVLLHAGDFSNTGTREEIESFAQWLEAYPAKEKVVIAGNHDITLHEEYYISRGCQRFHQGKAADCRAIRGLLERSCTYLEDTSTNIFGFKLYGSPWQPAFCDWAFNLPDAEACREKWKEIPGDVDILITHGPPRGFGDSCSNGSRVGCEELFKVVQSQQIPVVVSGHLHDDFGRRWDGSSLYINASTCDSGYRPSRPPVVFDLPAKSPAA